ncbi:MAG TPA: peptide deformylase [Rectinemataceae bacterium]
MKDVVTYGDPVLEKKAEAVKDFDSNLAALVEDMFEAMRRDRGIGLAAPQVGVSSRVFVVEIEGDKRRVFVNPEIVSTSPETCEYEEGCLSFPGLYFNVKRAASVKIQAFDEKGKAFTLEAEGLLARVILHEYDHLDGTLFIERISAFKKERALAQYKKLLRM